jgi:hypothetical protein
MLKIYMHTCNNINFDILIFMHTRVQMQGYNTEIYYYKVSYFQWKNKLNKKAYLF